MKSGLSSKEITNQGSCNVADLGAVPSLRFCPADYATGNTRARVAGWLSLQIVRFRVDHDRTANHRFCVVRERDLMVHVVQLGVAGSVCFDISHVALMARGCVGSGMRLVGGIEMCACRTEISCAAIAEFMHVKAVFSGSQACDLCVDLHATGDWRE